MTRTGVSRREAEELLERAHIDPVWLARLRAAYSGRHDVLDALWWAAHPRTASPRGTEDPAARARELQRAVFSRDAAVAPRSEAVDPVTGERVMANAGELRLRELQAALARDTAALEEALKKVAELGPVAEAAIPEPADEPVQALPKDPDVSPPITDVDSRRRTRVIAIVVAIALAAVVLPGIPGVFAGLTGGTPDPSVPPAASPRALPQSGSGQVQPPLEMLADPSQEIEPPIRAMGVLEPTRNFRGLPTITEHIAWYLANGEDGDVCLLASTIAGTAMTNCIPEADFIEDGISLGMMGTYILDTGITRTVEEESFTLYADGTFSYEARVIDEPRRPH